MVVMVTSIMVTVVMVTVILSTLKVDVEGCEGFEANQVVEDPGCIAVVRAEIKLAHDRIVYFIKPSRETPHGEISHAATIKTTPTTTHGNHISPHDHSHNDHTQYLHLLM